MNLVKITKTLIRSSSTKNNFKKEWKRRLTHQKSTPPLTENVETKEESKDNNELPAKAEKLSRDIFGATILPQKISFENSKRLTENKVRLQDIPVVDENKAAEQLVAEKLKTRKVTPLQENQKEKDDVEVMIVSSDIMKKSRESKPAIENVFWVADSYEDIPGPRIFQTVVNALKQGVRQLTILSLFRFSKTNASAAFRTYGPIIKLPEILGGKIILISRPEHISAIFEQDQRFPINSTLDSVHRSRLQSYHKPSRINFYLTSDWEPIRQTMGEPFMKGLEDYFDDIDQSTGKLIRQIKSIRNRQYEVPPNFLFEINKWSLECLCSVIFDRSFGFLDYDSLSWPSKSSQLLYSLTVATKSLCHLESGFQFWRFMNTASLSALSTSCDVLESVVSEFVGQVQIGLIKRKEHSSDLGKVSYVEKLLLQEDLLPEDIVTIILDTLLIGMNTMSTALSFLLYHLSCNPKAQDELWKEVKRILPEKYSRLEIEQYSSLKYLKACLKESLRLKMPMPILSRVLSKNVIVSNYQIPKGTFVMMTPQVEGLKEENFDNPEEFTPARWLDSDSFHPFTMLPMRNYFEENFERKIGEASLTACAAQIIRNFQVEYHYGDVEATSTAISFPNKPLKFTLIDRKE